jgi:AraC-like DNA-binding protein
MLAGMSMTLSTGTVSEPDRLAYWTDLVCNTYVQLACDTPDGDGTIDGEIVSDEMSTLHLSRVTATAQTVRRTPALIARASEDHFMVNVQTRGRGVVSQDGRDAVLTPGDFALYDSTRPYQLSFHGPFQQLVLKVPGPTLRTALRETHHLTATTVRGDRGAGHILIRMIRTLAADIGSLAPESAAAIADSVTHILAAGLATLPAARPLAVSRLTTFHREQIKDFVAAHLGDPCLSVSRVANALKLSASTLHRAWSGEPCSLADHIRAQRLDAVRRALCDPAHAARSVSEIAFGLGFNDAAHFSRAFRTRFGCSPREMRNGAARPVTGHPHGAA